jgi:hypothetical protein
VKLDKTRDYISLSFKDKLLVTLKPNDKSTFTPTVDYGEFVCLHFIVFQQNQSNINCLSCAIAN